LFIDWPAGSLPELDPRKIATKKKEIIKNKKKSRLQLVTVSPKSTKRNYKKI
jgi:hypothetical protein